MIREYLHEPRSARYTTEQCRVVGENVHRLRQALGWSSAELTRRAGFGCCNTVRSAERAAYRTSHDTVARIAKALGTTPAELLRGARKKVRARTFEISPQEKLLVQEFRLLDDAARLRLIEALTRHNTDLFSRMRHSGA